MKKSILLVDDNPNDRILTIRALKSGDLVYQIDEAKDGQEALDYLFAKGDYSHRDPKNIPQMVLLDLKLPKVDGFEVLERIRENPNTQSVPVVMLTSSTEQQDLIRSYKLGVNSYVRKPINFDEFTETAKQLGRYWLLLNEVP